tara:strand:+ start:1585 stop:1818 length:234 start_codon:yes stop_codon:yes gene_type:complete
MPTYVFRNKDTDEIVEHQMSVVDLDQFKEDNPHLKIQLQPLNPISDHKSTMTRAGSEWQDKLKQIKKNAGRGSTIKV